MLKALVWGLGAGTAIQAWRQWPANGPVTMNAAVVVFLAGLLCAYLVGRFRGRGGASASAVAVASASAEATSSSQAGVQFVNVMPGAHVHADGVRVPSESAPWLSAGPSSVEVSADILDGQDERDLADVLDLDRDVTP